MADAAERPRRFYRSVDVAPAEGGFGVRLDGRNARTPRRALLVAPTERLARLLADEWQAQDPEIRSETMPATRLANTAIDHVGAARQAVAAEVARYAGSDLTCYLAEGPSALVAQQTARWGAVRDWAERELGVALTPVAGVTHQAQPAQSLARVEALGAGLDDFSLAGLAHATSLFGSAVIALALQRGVLSGEEAFELSRLDEAFQESQWGVDAEAAERTARLREDALMLDAWFRALEQAAA